MADNVVDDEGIARDAGYDPVWLLWRNKEDHVYMHEGDPCPVRLVLWGGGSWASVGDEELETGWNGVDSPNRNSVGRVFRVPMVQGDRLRISLGGRATINGRSGGWGDAGDYWDMAYGRCRRGGWPDGGNGDSQDLTVVAGNVPLDEFGNPTYERPGGSQEVTIGRNGSGGSTRVWLTPFEEDERLIIIEPGYASSVPESVRDSPDPVSEFDPRVQWSGGDNPIGAVYRPQWGLWVDPTAFTDDDEREFSWSWPGFGMPEPYDPNLPHPIFGSLAVPVGKRGPTPGGGATVVFDDQDPDHDVFSGPDMDRWRGPVDFHGTDPGDRPGPGALPRAPLPHLTGQPGRFAFSWFEWTDSRQGEEGGTSRGADSRPTAFGPTGSGGGGFGGGGGGSAGRLVSQDDEWSIPGFSISIGSFRGRAGGRWWHDDHVERVADEDVLADRPSWLEDGDPDDIVWPTDSGWYPAAVYRAQGWPWLIEFGAAWLCSEIPGGNEPEPAWVVGRIAAGALAGVSTNLAGIVQAAVDS